MNAELIKKALEKVQDPHVLVNLVSRRVRQFNAGARPMITETGTLGFADIALVEIIEEKMGFDMPEIIALIRPAAQNRRKPQGWVKAPAPKVKLAA
jgi:DNA-directed RNA polymerase subunit K/omega